MKNLFLIQFKIFTQTMHWCCFIKVILTVKHQKSACLFHFAEKSFSVFNGAPSDTLKVSFGEIIYYFFFNIHEKCVLYQFKNFISTIHWCCQKIWFISVKYFKISISKSFMRPHFFFDHPLCLRSVYRAKSAWLPSMCGAKSALLPYMFGANLLTLSAHGREQCRHCSAYGREQCRLRSAHGRQQCSHCSAYGREQCRLRSAHGAET